MSKRAGVTSAAMYEKLRGSGLTRADAKRLRCKFLRPRQTAELTGSEDMALASMQLPYFEPDGRPNCFWRTRLLEGRKGFKRKPQRYTQPRDAVPRLYLPPLLPRGLTWKKVAGDPSVAMLVTEGELKAACATKHGYPTVGLGGVYSWRSAKKGVPLIEDFAGFDWSERRVTLVFDSDLRTNPHVQAALYQLSRRLTDLGAAVSVADLPEIAGLEGKTGLDDFIVDQGPEAFGEVVALAEPFDMSRELHRLNSEVAYVEDPGLVLRLDTGQKMRPSDFSGHAFADRSYFVTDSEGKLKELRAASAWLRWPGRSVLRGITYEPGGPRVTEDLRFNEWRGWGAEPERGDVSPWSELLDYVFGGDRGARQWFERWCAHQVQRPGVKLFTSVLLWSVYHGTGKSLTGLTLGEIFGDNFSEIDHDSLEKDFNSWAVNKQFVLGDEVTGTDSRRAADRLKGMITRKRVFINQKYVPEYSVPDLINYLFTSNHPDAFFLEDTDRRYFVWEVQGRPLPDEFYKRYDEWLWKGGGPAHLFDHLLRLDLGDFNPKARAPMTDAKYEMIAHTRSALDHWVAGLLDSPGGEGGVPVESAVVKSDQLLHLYDPESRTRTTAAALGRALKRAGCPCRKVRVAGSTPWLYAIRDQEDWGRRQTREWASEWERHFGRRPPKYKAPSKK